MRLFFLKKSDVNRKLFFHCLEVCFSSFNGAWMFAQGAVRHFDVVLMAQVFDNETIYLILGH